MSSELQAVDASNTHQNVTFSTTEIVQQQDESIEQDPSIQRVNSLSFDIAMTPRTPMENTPKDLAAIQAKIKIAKKIVQIILEIITMILSLAFVGSLIAGAALRTNYASTTYLTLFIINTAMPSSFGYYLYVPINRFWMYTPQLPLTIASTLLSGVFLTIQISFQIAYAAGATFDATWLLEDFGIVQLSKMDASLLSMNILPEILVFVIGATTLIFQCVLWRLRVYWKVQFFQEQVTAQVESPKHFDDVYGTFSSLYSNQEPSISVFDRAWILLLLMITGSIYPCFMSFPFFSCAIVLIVFSAMPLKIPSSVYCIALVCVAFYSALIIYLLNSSRMWYMSLLKDNKS